MSLFSVASPCATDPNIRTFLAPCFSAIRRISSRFSRKRTSITSVFVFSDRAIVILGQKVSAASRACKYTRDDPLKPSDEQCAQSAFSGGRIQHRSCEEPSSQIRRQVCRENKARPRESPLYCIKPKFPVRQLSHNRVHSVRQHYPPHEPRQQQSARDPRSHDGGSRQSRRTVSSVRYLTLVLPGKS
jgi:hypothetical protein